MDSMRMLELSAQGFQCAQILLIQALELDDNEDAALVRAAGGLNMGLADYLGPCGALTGGCCFISYFAGKGDKDELEDPALKEMLAGLAVWFREAYGGQVCADLLDGDINNMPARCPKIVQATYNKAMELLEANGVI